MTEAAALRLILSLLAIIALILAGAWLARRSGWLKAGAGGSIRVLGTHSLGARASLAVVQIEDARLVLGVTPGQISLLHTLPPAANPQTPDRDNVATLAKARPADFGAALRRALSRRP
ncbi:MAG TPA: flagellar biosynthetic protein FliO [Burkholderiaceae bacterium]|nr:flagellar biosynthetic protein FliO [Burkholderiaceae bacterium]